MLPLVLLSFLPILLVVLLALIPTKSMVISRPPRIYPLLGGTLGCIIGALYFGVSYLPEPLYDRNTGQLVADAGWRVELLMAGLGGILGCFAGIIILKSSRTILLRAFHNLRRFTQQPER